MNKANCKDLLQTSIGTIVTSFDSGVEERRDKILSCLYTCLKNTFIKWATIAYKSYPADFIGNVSDSSFTDCLIRFREFADNKKLYHGNATIKAVVFGFFKNTLRENLQKENRLAAKYQLVNVDEAAQAMATDEQEKKEALHQRLEQALKQMKEDDRQIIVWRHIEEKTNQEIAMLLNITVPSATNRIYRCMERLKALLEN